MTPSAMADDMIDLSQTDVFIPNFSSKPLQTVIDDNAFIECHIGEIIFITVKCKLSEEVVKKLKTHSNRSRGSPLITNLTSSVKRQLAANAVIKYSVKPCCTQGRSDQYLGTQDWQKCYVKLTSHAGRNVYVRPTEDPLVCIPNNKYFLSLNIRLIAAEITSTNALFSPIFIKVYIAFI